MGTGELQEEYKHKAWQQILTEYPAVRRVLGLTHPYTEYREQSDKYKTKVATEKIIKTRALDNLVDRYMKEPTPTNENAIDDFIDKHPDYDQKYLRARAERHQELWGIPNRQWWIDLSMLQSPEAKAEMYHERYMALPPKEKEEMEDLLYSNAALKKAIATHRFEDALLELDGKKN